MNETTRVKSLILEYFDLCFSIIVLKKIYHIKQIEIKNSPEIQLVPSFSIVRLNFYSKQMCEAILHNYV